MFRRTRIALAAAAVSLGLVATTSPAATSLPEWRTAPLTHNNPRAHTPRVVDLRYAEHGSFDRVVIDIKGRAPGYDIKYTRRLTFDGSGQPVGLRGKQKMSLVLRPAFGHDDQGRDVYRGPNRARVDFPTLRASAVTGDFEGHFSLGFGLARRAPYRIFTLHNPTRIVVDWKH